jgi:hippurate hydrolase
MSITLALLLTFPAAEPLPQAAIEKRIADGYASLDALYKDLHAHPELGFQEVRTAARLAKELKAAGFTVTEKVGGTGVVAVFKNGDGPTVLVRADMDGLPIIEKTDLPYASKETVRDSEGREVGVMHACGHDINVTCLVGVARVLSGMKEQWKGTLVFIGQPAEEIGAGAKKMLDDGLLKRFPKPDVCLALHCDGRYPHGTVNYRSGIMQAHVDSVDIIVKGKGGHGAAPQTTIDPIVLSARIILDLQTITSREQDPTDPAVVTVGSIHGGTKHNIIPNDVKLQLTVRTTKDATRERVLQSIERIAKAASKGANAPEPEVKIDREAFTPALVNNADLTKQFVRLFEETLGKQLVNERPMSMGGEDFSQFIRAGIPGFYWHIGTAPPERVNEWKEGGKPVAFTHSDGYYPVPEPTNKTGVLTMTLGVLKMLKVRKGER